MLVTGTHIRAPEGFSAPVPVQVVGAEQIESFGAVQFGDLLKAIPGNSGSESYTEAQPRAGNVQFNLRGLGYNSTLTLLNGRRAGISPLSDETGSQFVDINQFPLSMVERIEVLKDGASAIYGSDAVAGVVNVITRRGFEGVEITGGYQDATNESWNINFALGSRFDRGSFNAYGTYFDQTGNDRTDFDWLVERIGGNGVIGRSQLLNNNGAPGTYRRAAFNGAGQPIGMSGAVGFADPNCEAAGGVFRITDSGAVDRSSCLVDFADQVGIIPAARRAQVFTEWEYELGDAFRLIGEASFSRNELISTRGPGSYGNGAVVANSAGNIFIPASHPFNFFTADPNNPTRLVYVDPSQWNPAVHTAVDVVASSRIFGSQYFGDGAGERRTVTDYFRAVSGFELDLPNAWQAKASYQFASGDSSDMQDYRYRADTVNALLLSGQLNPFGLAISNPTLVSPKDGRSVAANDPSIIKQVFNTSNDSYRTQQQVLEGVVTGDVFELPAGPVGVAVGAQYRLLDYDQVQDSLQASGRGDNPSIQFPIHDTQEVVAGYVEASIPIASIASTQLAVRYEDYGSGIGSSVDPKFAARVTPMPGFSIRGSVSTSFQAPTILQTSESLSRSFVNDPTSVDAGTVTCRNSGRTSNPLVRIVGNDELDPQKSLNYSLGMVVEPVRRLSVSADYWRYRYKDLIAAALDAQAIINADCQDGIPNDPRIIRDGAGLIVEVDTAFTNVGKVITDGLDLAANYEFEQGVLGRFSTSIEATYLNKFDIYGSSGPAYDGAGSRNAANPFRTMPKWRGSASLGWLRGQLGANLNVRFTDGYENDASNNAPIGSFTTLDLSLAYAFSNDEGEEGAVVTVGADNIFDRDPPSLIRYDANGNRISGTINDVDRPSYDAYSGADIRGRVLYVRFKQSF